MLELILGRSGSGKTAAVMASIARAAAEKTPGSILLVPEQYSHEAERELCAVCGDSLSLYAEVLSFTGLCRRVESELGGCGKKTLDKGGRLLCMAMAAEAASPVLKVYQSSRRRAELLKSLLEAVDELKSACVTPEMLSKAAGGCSGVLADKLSDLSAVMSAYDAFVARSAADPSDALTRLAEKIGRSRVCRGHIYIDGFIDFTRQETEVIRALIAAGADLTVCLTCDSIDGGSEIFGAARRTALTLRRLAAERGDECRITYAERSGGGDAMDHIEQNLFGYTSEPFGGDAACVSLVLADTAGDECAMAASIALSLVRDTGCRWRDIAVAVRGFEDYRPGLERAFRRCGVPLYAGKRTDLMKKTVPALIFSAIDAVTGGWEYEDVFSYLKTGLAGISADECDILENYVLMWDIRGSAWTRRGDWTQHPDGYGCEYDEDAKARLDEINALRRTVSAPLSTLQERGRSASSAAEQCAALSDFLVGIGLPERLAQRAGELRGSGREREAGEYSQLWGIVVSALEQLAAVMGGSLMTQEEFARLFKLVLSQYDVGTIPVALDRVLCGDFDRMRRRHIKHLIVLGAGDDRLPAVSEHTGIFSDADRDELAALDIDLGSGEDEIYREMNLIYSCLTLPSDSLTVSCPCTDSEGGETRPSFVMDRLSLLFGKAPCRFDRESASLSAPETAFCLASWGRSPKAAAAREYFRRAGMDTELRRLSALACSNRGSLTPEAVRELYGDKSRMSATRAEAFVSCPYSYFMRYGLRAKPREPAGFEAPEMGTFMHYVLENVARDIAAMGGFADLAPGTAEALADKYVEEYIRTELGSFREKSQRFVYLFRRLTGTVRQVVADMAKELSYSDFVPLDFELDFTDRERIDPTYTGHGTVQLTGIADRVDGWLCGDTLYLRVVDYKTGYKSFSLSDICSGLGMQMLLYLFALGERGQKLYGAHKVVPAGVLYVPARTALVSADADMDDDSLEAEKAKKLRRSGLILNDDGVIAAMEKGETPQYIPVKFKNGVPTGDALASAEQFGALAAYIDETLAEISAQLRSGSIDACPTYRSEQDNACRWCDYASVCRFDEMRDRRRRLKTLNPQEAWDIISTGGGR